jgi:hypothetical protein
MSNANPKTKSKTKAMIPRQRPTLFERPLLLQGEDATACDALFAGIRAAVKPLDTLDVVALEWEVLRWRRLESIWCACVSVKR